MNWKKFYATICATMLISATALSAEMDSPSEVRAQEIDYDMDSGVVQATGNVSVSHSQKSKAAENNVPSEVNADSVDYDMNTGLVTAVGNVHLKYGSDWATGGRATYNVNTEEAYFSGGVKVSRENFQITCDSLSNDGAGHMTADGNVHATQTIPPSQQYPNGDTRTFTGDHVDYYPNDRKHVIIPGGGRITNADGNFTANHIEGWIDEEYYTGSGNVHIVNPPRELEAGGDRVDYYAKDNGKAVLTGNAWAIQNNNTMRGNRLTVYLTDDRKPAASPSKRQQTTAVLPHEVLTNQPFRN